jgi:hypothetical protein
LNSGPGSSTAWGEKGNAGGATASQNKQPAPSNYMGSGSGSSSSSSQHKWLGTQQAGPGYINTDLGVLEGNAGGRSTHFYGNAQFFSLVLKDQGWHACTIANMRINIHCLVASSALQFLTNSRLQNQSGNYN